MTIRALADDLPLAIDDVTVSLNGATILKDISLTIAAGPPMVLVGPNGAGKTTLLRLAMGLVAPSRGRITWGGRDRGSSSQRAFVFQRPAMLRRSAIGNIRFALASSGVPRALRQARAEQLLARVGLSGLGDRPARQLSGGERQRLALARALARDPDVLFLDEPTASLDPAATKAVEDVIRDAANGGIKIVMSTHDLGEARRIAGDIVLLHRGCIAETAPVADFFSAPRTDHARRFIAGELLV